MLSLSRSMPVLRPVAAEVSVPLMGSLALVARVATRPARPVLPPSFSVTAAASVAYAAENAASSSTSLP